MKKQLFILCTALLFACAAPTTTVHAQYVGVNDSAPSASLTVGGIGTTATTSAFFVHNHAATPLLSITDGGMVSIGSLQQCTIDGSGNVATSGSLTLSSLVTNRILMTGAGGLVSPVMAPTTNTFLNWNGTNYSWTNPISKITIPMLGMAAAMTGALGNSYFVYQNGTAIQQSFFAASISSPAALTLGSFWMAHGPGYQITSDATVSKIRGMVYSSTANRNFTVYAYRYTPVGGSNATITPVLIGSASVTCTTINVPYTWQLTLSTTALTAGDEIFVFYGTSDATSASYFFRGSIELLENTQ